MLSLGGIEGSDLQLKMWGLIPCLQSSWSRKAKEESTKLSISAARLLAEKLVLKILFDKANRCMFVIVVSPLDKNNLQPVYVHRT